MLAYITACSSLRSLTGSAVGFSSSAGLCHQQQRRQQQQVIGCALEQSFLPAASHEQQSACFVYSCSLLVTHWAKSVDSSCFDRNSSAKKATFLSTDLAFVLSFPATPCQHKQTLSAAAMTQPVWKLLATLLAICNISYVSGVAGNWLCCRHTCFTTSSRHSIYSTHNTRTVDVNRLIKGCSSLKVICNSCCALQVPVDHHCVQYHIYSGSLCLVAVLSGGA